MAAIATTTERERALRALERDARPPRRARPGVHRSPTPPCVAARELRLDALVVPTLSGPHARGWSARTARRCRSSRSRPGRETVRRCGLMWGVKAASMQRHEVTEDADRRRRRAGRRARLVQARAARRRSRPGLPSGKPGHDEPVPGPAALRWPAIQTALATRRRVLELAETQRFVHHVADLDTGEVVTTELDRPVTPISRAARLSRFGPVFDPTIFGHPIYRLGARTPYQATPEGWIELTRPTSTAPAVDTVYWDLPRDYDFHGSFAGMFLTFTECRRAARSRASPCPATRSPGPRARSCSRCSSSRTRSYIPVDANFGHHTVDLTFVPPQRLDVHHDGADGEHRAARVLRHDARHGAADLEPGVFA